MSKLLIIIVSIFLTINLWSQKKYSGTVYDVGSRLALENVSVQATNSERQDISSPTGTFSIFLKYAWLALKYMFYDFA